MNFNLRVFRNLWVNWSPRRRRVTGGLGGCGTLLLCACCAILAIFPFLPDTETSTPAPTNPTIQPPNNPTPDVFQTLISVPTIAPTDTSVPIIQPTQPPVVDTQPPPAPAFTLINLTSPINAGQTASASIQTTPGANCFISYHTPSGTDSTAAGLGAITADGNGICSWSWEIGGNTNSGTGRVTISAGGDVQTFPIEIR